MKLCQNKHVRKDYPTLDRHGKKFVLYFFRSNSQRSKRSIFALRTMDLLWKEESVLENAPYRDLFVNIKHTFPEWMMSNMSTMAATVFEGTMQKINAFSEHHRKKGNEKFSDGKWNEAIKLYNQSLCFAEVASENLALAYGNRSACYFQLKMFGNCLIDIELAVSGKCPDRLKVKLEKRKADCLNLVQLDTVTDYQDVHLSYEANKNYPCMANILKFQYNDEYGRHIITECDIPAGKTVLIEDNFISYTKSNNFLTEHKAPSDEQTKCITCNKATMNPIPCTRCTLVMFCSTVCQNENKIHKIDCGAVYHLDDSINNKYIIQSILVAVNMFPNVKSLMDFVRNVVTSKKSNEIPTSVLDQHSTYELFLKLWTPSKMEDFVTVTYNLYNTILRFKEIQKIFDSTIKQRFLMHLVGQHALILLFNSTQGQMCIFTSIMSHSCVPNIQEIWIDNRTAGITIRPIKKGEQLFISYMPEAVGKMLNKDHKTELYIKYGFKCKCLKCANKLEDLIRIERDQCFLDIDNTTLDEKNKVLLEQFNGKCIKVLNEYKDLPWSLQLDNVSSRLGFSLGLFHYKRFAQ